MIRFLEQSWLEFKANYATMSFEELVFFQILNPIMTLVFYVILAAYSFNTDNLTSWVVGNSLLLCTSLCIFSLGLAFDREKFNGRIRSIIASPRNKIFIVLEKGVTPMIVTVVMVFFGFMMASFIFGVNFSRINLWLFFLVTLVGMFATTGFALFISTFGLISSSMHFILNVTYYILMLFSGANFPVSQLPDWIQFVSKILPLSRSIAAANILFIYFDKVKFINLLLGEVIVGAIYYALASFVISYVEKIAKEKATLELF